LKTLGSIAFAVLAAACGGASSDARVALPEPAATDAGSSAVVADADAPRTSVIHFDDLGVTFAVPPGFHVVGDSELAARIGSSANAHLQADLRKRAEAKRGIPLLALSKEDLNVTLSVVVVPADALPMELANHQQEVMAANLDGFELASPPKDHAQDGVPGAEMSTRYLLDKKRVASRMRLFVRPVAGTGVATLVTAVWTESAAKGDEAGALLDGLHFTAPSE